MEARANPVTTPAAQEQDQQQAISFRNVGKIFPDGTEAIREVSFDLRPGEFVSIVGPSGCGKSTLLRLASDLEPITSGTMDRAVDNIGYVFQDATLLPWRTVEKNVQLFAEFHGIAREERETLVQQALDLVGLQGFEKHRPAALSGGMKMRVSLARAMTLQPRLFLFDEPFGALDEITRGQLNEELQRLFLSQRFAGMFITHSISEAVYLATRVLVMSARPGVIVEEFEVPFDYPRSPDLRFDTEFAVLSGRVSEALKDTH